MSKPTTWGNANRRMIAGLFCRSISTPSCTSRFERVGRVMPRGNEDIDSRIVFRDGKCMRSRM